VESDVKDFFELPLEEESERFSTVSSQTVGKSAGKYLTEVRCEGED
jgi:hypothetical protein